VGIFYNIAIVGRPNVGKSRLFNRLVRRRVSIVHDIPGVTRDIITHEIGKNIILMDTGGLGLVGGDSIGEISAAVDDQVNLAIAAADMILFVVDATAGIAPMDYDIAEMLHKSGVDVTVIANKIDDRSKEAIADPFSELGFGRPIVVSAEHGIGEDEIRELIAEKTAEFSEPEESKNNAIKLAIVGRPNVGKSSIVNALFNEQRVIVSDIPGTTRETVSVKLGTNRTFGTHTDFELLDTAGARPQNRITTSLDYFSSLRTRDSIADCHVAFLVVDATSGITKLDKKIANGIIEAGKGMVVVVNKWDIAQESFLSGNLKNFTTIEKFQESFRRAARKELHALPGIDVIFISAKTGHGIDTLLQSAENLYGRMGVKIGTGLLNRAIQQALERRPPSTSDGRAFRIYYVVQTGNMPFVFKFFCNRTSLLGDNYKKYLLNTLRSNFELAGCSIRMEFCEKDRRFGNVETQD
jgi:GTP-binding protein